MVIIFSQPLFLFLFLMGRLPARLSGGFVPVRWEGLWGSMETLSGRFLHSVETLHKSPSQPKLASSLHNKRLSYWRLTGCGRNDGGKRIGVIHGM